MNLHNLHILITRPVHQAAGLAERITTEGGIATVCPTLEIIDPPDTSSGADRSVGQTRSPFPFAYIVNLLPGSRCTSVSGVRRRNASRCSRHRVRFCDAAPSRESRRAGTTSVNRPAVALGAR